MRTASLEVFGVDRRILEAWEEAGHRELLPIQETAVRKGKVLEGGSAVVFSPTSSGKTFIGEMAAVQTARRNQRAIYLVPQKALAEEKYREFKSRYSPFGIRVVISTRDRTEHDRAINRGEFHIAVVVFEKLQSLMVASPGILRNVGLVVIDELQMIGDAHRGAGLEILLTKIILEEQKPQIVGLSAVLGNARGLARWLGATLCEDSQRPVELRKGVLCGGTFRYVEHNSGREGEETFGEPGAAFGEPLELTALEARRRVEQGEQCIVFRKSRKECLEAARFIAHTLNAAPAHGAINELAHLEESHGRGLLTELLQSGVAYHTAELDWDQREVIERAFRNGEVRVICATTTLAMGMNLPAKNVFVDTERWDRDRAGRLGAHAHLAIRVREHERPCGKARARGRVRPRNRRHEFALPRRTSSTTPSSRATSGEVEPRLDEAPLAQHVLNLVASGLCRTRDEIREILLASYTGELHWRGGRKEIRFTAKLDEALQQCLAGGLMADGKRGLEATALGMTAAAKGITVDTAVAMAAFVKEHADVSPLLDPFEIIWALTGTECGEAVYFNMSTTELRSGEYTDLFSNTYFSLPEAVRARMNAPLSEWKPNDYDDVKRAKKAMILHAWVTGVPTVEMETRFHCYSGSIRALGTEFSWLADALAGVAGVLGWPEAAVAQVRTLADQLVHGVQAEGLALARAGVSGLGRGRISALVAAGITELEAVTQASREMLRKLVTSAVADRLVERAPRAAEAPSGPGRGGAAN